MRRSMTVPVRIAKRYRRRRLRRSIEIRVRMAARCRLGLLRRSMKVSARIANDTVEDAAPEHGARDTSPCRGSLHFTDSENPRHMDRPCTK